MATLSRISALRLVNRKLRRCRNGSGKFRNRRQHLSPMPERDAELFEVLIAQMTEDGSVDVVFSKTQGVLGHAALFEPIPNLLHCEHPATVMPITKISDKHSDVNCAARQSVRAPSDLFLDRLATAFA